MSEPGRAPSAASTAPRDESWGTPRPSALPRPTSSPALCAAGVVLLFWSIVASPVLAVFGGGLFIVSFVIWIRELSHERRIEREHRA